MGAKNLGELPTIYLGTYIYNLRSLNWRFKETENEWIEKNVGTDYFIFSYLNAGVDIDELIIFSRIPIYTCNSATHREEQDLEANRNDETANKKKRKEKKLKKDFVRI